MEFYCLEYTEIVDRLRSDESRASDAYAVRRVCHELSRAVLQRRSSRLEMVQEGVLHALVPIVAQHASERADVISDCCRFLRRLISLKEPSELDIQSKIAEAGFLDVAMTALTAHPTDRALFTEVCRLVSLLCFDMPHAPHADNQESLAAAGVLRSVIERLTRDNLDDDESAIACDAIYAMVYEHAEMLDQDSVVELGIVERLLQYMETRRAECDVLLQWHVLKAVEMLCRSSADRQVDTRRVDLLMQAGAPQFALSVIKTPAVVQTPHVAEQAIRLLELLASNEANRIPLTRLGASRAVKVVYNSTQHAGVLVLCERAASAIEGT
ncbi:hypothetical protein PINS_up010444 [Pythium insidiosum]|nr:hypothetical protein PINS_up010444 [Pythium insidiosum]